MSYGDIDLSCVLARVGQRLVSCCVARRLTDNQPLHDTQE